MQLKTGGRLKSAVCTTEVIVVKAPDREVEVTCGGSLVRDPTDPAPPSGAPNEDAVDGTLVGKRYSDADDTIELLCTKAGDGSLAVDGTLLAIKEMKPLPASD